MNYTVKQLADLAGVSPRTLHYYDEIGLLAPERIGDNGYRYYGEGAVLRLQQILFYRELDMPLMEIKRLMGRSDFNIRSALEDHRQALGRQVQRLNHLIQTVDDTLLHLKGSKKMKEKQLFEAFSEEQQEEYARQAEQVYDPEIVRASNRKWKSYSPGKKKQVLEEGRQVYLDILAVMDKGPASPEVQACIARWREHMDYFWTPNLDQLLALAQGYNQDERFKQNFDAIDPRLAAFMLEAVKEYMEIARK